MLGLTEAECKVLALRIAGWSPHQVAQRYDWKVATAHRYMVRIRGKIGIKRLDMLREWAIENGLPPEPENENPAEPFGRRKKLVRTFCQQQHDLMREWSKYAAQQTWALRSARRRGYRVRYALDALERCKVAAAAYFAHRDEHRC